MGLSNKTICDKLILLGEENGFSYCRAVCKKYISESALVISP